jgi:hypothetical protein
LVTAVWNRYYVSWNRTCHLGRQAGVVCKTDT